VSGALVLKLGGELLESAADRARIASFAASVAPSRPLVVIHGGGRAVDAELARRGIAPKKVDGLRVTDADTLDVVVSVLGGASNTALVAALAGQNVAAVGLTGADAGLGRAARVSAHQATNGAVVDLGFVGDPAEADAALVELLLVNGYVPVIASLGIDAAGGETPSILNVNADVMACRIAAALPGCDLVIAGTTPGVFDGHGKTIASLDVEAIDALVTSGTATAGMIAKLTSCKSALLDGVASVRIIDGRSLDATHGIDAAKGTTLTKTGGLAPSL